MRGLLLDTHVWFWYLMGSERLPEGLRDSLDRQAGRIWLSPISMWELGVLETKGRLLLQGGVRAWVTDAMKCFPLRLADLNTEVALSSLELELPHRDPADRFLAATALVFDLTLATVDQRLVEADWLTTQSN